MNLFRDQLDRYGELEHLADRWERLVAELPPGVHPGAERRRPGHRRPGRRPRGRADLRHRRPGGGAAGGLPHAADSTRCRGVLGAPRPTTWSPSATWATGAARAAALAGPRPTCARRGSSCAARTASRSASRPPGARSEARARPPRRCTTPTTPRPPRPRRSPWASPRRRDRARPGGAARRPSGAAERVRLDGRELVLLLAKNPTGANETVRTVLLDPEPPHLLIALNDRTADGHDVSWIWDVDYEPLLARAASLTLTGDRAYDLALRVRYAGRRGRADDACSPTPRRALDARRGRHPGRRHALRAAHLHGDARPARDAWCAAAWRRPSGVSDDEARRASRSSTPTTREDLPFWRAAAARLGSPVLDLGARHRPRRPAAGPRRRRGVGARPLARRCSPSWSAACGPSRRTSRGAGPHRRAATCARFDLGRRFRAGADRDEHPPGPDRAPTTGWPACARVREHLAAGRRADLRRRPARRARRSSPPWAWSAPAGATTTPRAGRPSSTRPGTTAGSPAPSTLEFTLRIASGGRRRPAAHGPAPAPRAPVHARGDRPRCWPRAGLEPIGVLGDFDGAPVGPPAPSARSTAAGPPHEHRCRLVGHLYPGEMNIYADRGNIAVLRAPPRLAGPRAGGDRARHRRPGRRRARTTSTTWAAARTATRPSWPTTWRRPRPRACARPSADGAAVLCVCGGFQLAGHGYTGADGSRMPGVGILDLDTVAGPDAADRQPRDRGRPRRRARTARGLREPRRAARASAPAARPLGRVVSGHGNNGDDGGEGGVAGRVIGTYLHGPLLPKNPWLADLLIAWALEHATGAEPAAGAARRPPGGGGPRGRHARAMRARSR